MAEESLYYVVESSVLPEVFAAVLRAKQLLADGTASSAAEAARLAGISRSAFYKYKDKVFVYNQTEKLMTLHTVLTDQPGVLSSLLSAYAQAGANVLTVFQDIPAGDTASVSISARVDSLQCSPEEFVRRLEQLPGVLKIIRVGHQKREERMDQS